MGLDQYITIRHKSTNNSYKRWNDYWKMSKEERKGRSEPSEPSKDLILGYFRKHNNIHKWFVNNIQNGVDDYTITDEGLEFVKENLPTNDGFFFGSTEYDNDYFWTVENAINVLTQVITICNLNYFRLYTDRETGVYNGEWVLEYTSSW